MTDREKLIELIEQCSCPYSPPCTSECSECNNVEMYDEEIAHIADHLLANGVMVQKHGRWVEKPFLLGTTNVCSCCGDYFGMPHGKFRYCPNCGARMMEGNDVCV